MRKQSLLVLVGVMCCGTSVRAAAVALDDRPLFGAKQVDVRPSNDAAAVSDSVVAAADNGVVPVPPEVQVVRLDPNMVFGHVVVGADGVASVVNEGATAAVDERLIYDNTLGMDAVAFPISQLVADDITTTAPVGCNLTRFRFRVLGKVFPTGVGGAYTVRYSLYNNCPQAVSPTERTHYTDEPAPNTGIKIRGTDGQLTFPDETPQLIEHVISFPTIISLPTNVWLGISFTRSNCGVVVGAPAMVGFSADSFDYPGFPCNSNLGGFPELPQASFWTEIYGGTNCSDSFVGYKAAMANGPKFSAGPSVPFYDDVKLIVNNCQMIGYEVAVRGQGFYEFSLHRDCSESSEIAGTKRNFTVGVNTRPQLQLARFTFNPPVQLTTDTLYFWFRVNNDTAGGVVMAGVQPTIGSSTENYYVLDVNGACEPKQPDPPLTGVFHASITCAGAQPLGACCDPYLTQCAGGPDDGKRCDTDADCTAPGLCNPVCRQIAKINCPFPPRNQDQDPKWQQGAICTPDPFGGTPCGLSACCHVTLNPITQNLDEVCDNLSQRDCNEAPPLDKPRLWQLGLYCGSGSQTCPRNACLGREGSCTVVHPTPGCNDPNCCTKVCTIHGPDGAFCCDIDWDSVCVGFAQVDCRNPPSNDSCAPDPRNRLDGALLVPVPGSVTTIINNATDDPNDPGFCCNNGVSACVGGSLDGMPCVVQTDCPDGFCPDLTPAPGMRGTHTVWFKFVQPAGFTSTQIYTCGSNAPARDSLLQVFKPGDNSSALNACRTLSVIGCNDDTPGCSSSNRNSKVCIKNLVPGETYYILLGTKTVNTLGEYRVTVAAGCTGGDVSPNDYCPNATTITDGVTPFFINVNTCVGGSNAGKACSTSADCPPAGTCPTNHTVTFDCPAEPSVPNGLNDLWYNYVATCNGVAHFETCGTSSATTPNTTLAIYADDTKCPPASGIPVGYNDDAFQNCGFGSRVAVNVQAGQTFKVRLADSQGFPISGNLRIFCTPITDCQPNGTPDDQDIANCPPGNPDCQDCNHNGIPDFCDIRDVTEQDCNHNGIPDSCDLAAGTSRDCQPNLIPDECDIASCHGESFCADVNHNGVPDICECAGFSATDPPNCAIDARQPYAPGNPAALQGWNSVALTFDPLCNVSGITAGDFTVSCTPVGPDCPTITTVSAVGQVVTANLSSVIPAQKWTCITHTASGKKVCLGSLPADANGDRTAAPADILDVIDNLNNVRVPPLQPYQCDIDRSNACAPADILSEIDLLNGANAFLVWNGKTLPVCPSP